MLSLYPDIAAYHQCRLSVDDIHELYVEECGNPDGVPVLFVHGGPGAGCNSRHRCFFDPEHYRIILFDQRGAGRSTPHAELRNNTTQDLIADIERIREALHVERWMLFGGSWGSTLSLLYAQAYPERVTAMILRGIFLCRPQDIAWFYQNGTGRLFPDYWQDFVRPVVEEDRGDMVSAYYRLLTGDDELKRMSAAKTWSQWEGRCATLKPDSKVVSGFSDPHLALAMARIEAHYFINSGFIGDNQILDNMRRIKDIPGIIVHGRYDVICPMDNAWALHRCWPASELEIIRDAGHSAGESGNTDALVRATIKMLSRLDGAH